MSAAKTPKKYSKEVGGLESNIYMELERYATSHKDAVYVYLGTKWGGYVQWPDGLDVIDYDPRKQAWYKQTLESKEDVIVSETYMANDGTNSIIVSTTSNIKDSAGEVVSVSIMSEEIAVMSEEITATVCQVSQAIQNMAQGAQKSNEEAETIKENINETTKYIKQVALTEQSQAELAQKLNETVQKFKI